MLISKIIKHDLKEKDILKTKLCSSHPNFLWAVAHSLSFQLNLHDHFINGNMSIYIY